MADYENRFPATPPRRDALAQPAFRSDADVHRWLCGFAAALIPTFGLLLWNASANPSPLPTLGWAVLFALFAGAVVGSLYDGWVRRHLAAIARLLYGALLVWTLVEGVDHSFSTEYAVVLLLAYTLAGIGLSVGLERSWPLAVYFGAAVVFVSVVYVRTSRAVGGGAPIDPLLVFAYLIGIGLVAFVVLSARIQAQRRLARSRARYRLLADNAFDLITLHDPAADYACRYASPAARVLLGRAPDALVGRSLPDLAAPSSRSDLKAMLDTIARTGAPQSVTVQFEHEDGHRVWLEGNGQAALDPETKTPSEIILVLRDVTARQERERKLREARDDARQAARAARETARAKTSFLAAMSHEVRTPLASILGFADVLVGTLDEGEPRELAGLIQQGGQRLADTLDSVLDLARIEAGTMRLSPRPVPLAACLRETAALFRSRVEEKGLALHLALPERDRDGEDAVDETCCAQADPALLARILNTLVANALKSTDEGHITLGARCSREGQVTLTVEDTGRGLSTTFRPHLLESLRKAPGRDGERLLLEGNGLGVFIVSRLIEQCGGSCSVDSKAGKGTRFTVRLPRAPAVASPADSRRAVPDEATAARVLLVEDHDDTRRLIKRLLQPPYRVVAAATTGEALHEARQYDFDVFLLDINLRERYGGIDLLEKLRSMPGYRHTPAVAVTAYALPEDRTRLLDAGFDEYLAKPFVREQLTDCVAAACRMNAPDAAPAADASETPEHTSSSETRPAV